jgi:hypothetical protein
MRQFTQLHSDGSSLGASPAAAIREETNHVSAAANGAMGRQFRDAALGWFEEVNGDGGVNGLRTELITLDDECVNQIFAFNGRSGEPSSDPS